jgi:hypothetical protein
VGEDVRVPAGGNLDGRGDLAGRELDGVERVGRRDDPARREELDLRRAAPELLADGPTDLVGTVDDHVLRDQARDRCLAVHRLVGGPVVAVAAGLRQHRPRRQDPRPADEPALDRPRPGWLEAARVADRREALVERAVDVRGDPEDVVDQRLVAVVALVADQREVDMGVGQARHERRPGAIDLASAADGRALAGAVDRVDLPVADDDIVAAGGLGAGAGEDGDVADDEIDEGLGRGGGRGRHPDMIAGTGGAGAAGPRWPAGVRAAAASAGRGGSPGRAGASRSRRTPR